MEFTTPMMSGVKMVVTSGETYGLGQGMGELGDTLELFPILLWVVAI